MIGFWFGKEKRYAGWVTRYFNSKTRVFFIIFLYVKWEWYSDYLLYYILNYISKKKKLLYIESNKIIPAIKR